MKRYLIFLLLLVLLVVPASAWLDGYTYRNEHYVTGNASWGGSLTDHHIVIDVYRSSGTNSGNDVYVGTNCQNDYDDIRFTDGSDTLLSYYIESATSSVAKIWVEYPTLTTGNNTLYMYYGNDGASAYSSGVNTFPLFDHFTGSSLNTTTWSSFTSGGSISVSSSILELKATSSYDLVKVNSIQTFTPNNSVRFLFYPHPTSAWSAGDERRYGFGDDTGDYALFSMAADTIGLDVSGGTGGGTYNPSGYGNYIIKATNPGATRYYHAVYPDNDIGVVNSTTLVSGEPIELYEYSYYGTNFYSYFDYIFVYNDNYYEPIHGVWSSAESIGTAAFSANVTYGPINQSILFTDASTGSPNAWYWDFGDGNTSTSQNPTNTYGYADVFTVILNASYYGVNETETKVDYISIGQPPTAAFTANKTSGSVPLAVGFTDTSTGGPTAWNWSFDDGTYSEDQNPGKSFTTRGNYTVILNASNAYGFDTYDMVISATAGINATDGYGIQYPPHRVEMTFQDKYSKPIIGATIIVTPLETTMGGWDWLYSLLGIDYEEVPLDTQVMTGTTDSEGSISFLMMEQIRYSVAISKPADGVSYTWYIYPKDEEYIFVTSTAAAPTPTPIMSSVIDWELEAAYTNDTYADLSFVWNDTGTLPVDYIQWTVTNSDGELVNTTLPMDGSNTSASYGVALNKDDETYTYGFKAYHPTYGWVNQTKVIVSHKEVDLGLPDNWKAFASFGLICLVGLMFSRKSWKVGMFATSAFAIVLTQIGILRVNSSYEVTMLIATGFLILSVFVLIRGSGDGSV
jgi:PKD repeat protein